MDTTNDVDEALLDRARYLLPFVRMNGHPDYAVKDVADIQWLVVLMFELLTAHDLPDDMKPFRTTEHRSQTLQFVIDALQEVLNLPLSHVTGLGLAKLDRRHLHDMLQMLETLIQHCYPDKKKQTKVTGKHRRVRAVEESHRNEFEDIAEGRRLTLSQLTSPASIVLPVLRATRNNQGYVAKIGRKTVGSNQRLDNSALCDNQARRGQPNCAQLQRTDIPPYIYMAPEPSPDDGRNWCTPRESDEAFVQEFLQMKPGHSSTPNETRIDAVDIKHTKPKIKTANKPVAKKPKSSLFDVQQSATKQNYRKSITNSKDHKERAVDSNIKDRDKFAIDKTRNRYTPIGKRPTRPCVVEKTSRNADRNLGRNLSSSVKRQVVRRPRVKSFASSTPVSRAKDKPLQDLEDVQPSNANIKVLEREMQRIFPRSKSFKYHDSVSSKAAHKSGLERVVSKSTTDLRSHPNVNKILRNAESLSKRYVSPKTSSSTLLRDVASDTLRKTIPTADTTSKPCSLLSSGRHTIRSAASKPASAPLLSSRSRKTSCRSVQFKTPTLSIRRRRGSTVDTKKESSPAVLSTKVRKRSVASPQTTSLVSSIKLLQEFDHVQRRLNDIRRQKSYLRKRFEADLQELEHEEKRLSSVVSLLATGSQGTSTRMRTSIAR